MSNCGCNTNTSLPTGVAGVNGTNGTNGTNGSNGLNGTTVLYHTSVPSAGQSTAVPTTMQSYLLPANQLITDGDAIEISCTFSKNVTTGVCNVSLSIGGAVMHFKQSLFPIVSSVKELSFKARVVRSTSTTLFITFETINSDANYYKLFGGSSFFETGVGINNSITNLIEIKGAASGTGDILTANNLTVIYFKK